ncbi:MAG: hypothetical protein SWY16_21115 [Cyanobacteriota bacterium]|nr:hypothetical protein [Cyanobacteriota bacterium]
MSQSVKLVGVALHRSKCDRPDKRLPGSMAVASAFIRQQQRLVLNLF